MNFFIQISSCNFLLLLIVYLSATNIWQIVSTYPLIQLEDKFSIVDTKFSNLVFDLSIDVLDPSHNMYW